MNYPNEFDTPTFPAGKAIALSRGVSIWTLIISFLIICACGLMLLLIRAKNNYPFLISTDPYTSDWSVVAYPEQKRTISLKEIVQENLVRRYVENWFSIYKNDFVNDSLWSECSDADCEKPEQYDPKNKKCALFCSSDTELFEQFTKKIVPEYRARIEQNSETMRVVSQFITPPVSEKNTPNVWQSSAIVDSSVYGRFSVLVFMELGKADGKYPATLGYYVKDFNSYRTFENLGIQ